MVPPARGAGACGATEPFCALPVLPVAPRHLRVCVARGRGTARASRQSCGWIAAAAGHTGMQASMVGRAVWRAPCSQCGGVASMGATHRCVSEASPLRCRGIPESLATSLDVPQPSSADFIRLGRARSSLSILASALALIVLRAVGTSGSNPCHPASATPATSGRHVWACDRGDCHIRNTWLVRCTFRVRSKVNEH